MEKTTNEKDCEALRKKINKLDAELEKLLKELLLPIKVSLRTEPSCVEEGYQGHLVKKDLWWLR